MRAPLTLLSLLLAGCSLVPGSTAALEKEARARLATTLFDAESARFQHLIAYQGSRPHGQRIICGRVNGKNGFGAYIGFHRIVIFEAPDFVYPEPTDDKAPHGVFDGLWSACVAHGAQ